MSGKGDGWALEWLVGSSWMDSGEWMGVGVMLEWLAGQR